jgi:hypothetical protein
MLISILILLILPFCSIYIKNINFISGFDNNFFFILFSLTITLLWFIGSLPAEYPYTFYGKVLTAFYFELFIFNYFYCKFHNKIVKYII